MQEISELESDIRRALEEGDSESIQVMPNVDVRILAKTICAFANTVGGRIYIGDPFAPDTAKMPQVDIVEMNILQVQRFTENLDDHFDDPLPTVDVEPFWVQPPNGPRTGGAVVVEVRPSGSEDAPVALSNLAIWRREGPHNVSNSARVRPNRGRMNGPGAQQLGNGTNISREATDEELALNVDDYAEVVSGLLSDAEEGEQMSFALFGHWGRGKTFLAKRVAKKLADNRKDRPKYRTVLFSAWKYRRTPEVWAHLFERFLQEGKHEDWLLPIRASLVRHGPWPLIFAMLGLFLSLWTMGERTQLLTALIQAVGIGTVLFGTFLYVRFRYVAVRLKTLYTLASHSDKLGLQAAIGDDLRSLLKAWCKKDLTSVWKNCHSWWKTVRETPNHMWGLLKPPWGLTRSIRLSWIWPSLAYLATALLISWKLWPVKQGLDWTMPLIGQLSTGVNSYIAFVIYAAWCVLWVVAPLVLFFLPRQSTDRVLLIVDDLDRCEPNQMLEIIESTMLILDDQDVHKRLQVCMLIEESAFEHAVIDKYKQLMTENKLNKQHRYTADRIVRENREKFFLVHLRLSALTGPEIAEVTESYVRQLQGTGDSNPAGPIGTDPSPVDLLTVHQDVTDTDANAPISTTNKPDPGRVSVIEEHEANAIIASVKSLAGDLAFASPRSLRGLLFRYQLARNLLSKLGERPDPQIIANAVVTVYANGTVDGNTPTTIENVVRQVS